MWNSAHAALWACALISFFGYFRKSNTTVDLHSPAGVGKCLRVATILVVEKDYALAVTAPGSKTRQFGAGPTIWISGHRGHLLDAVAAWQWHCQLSRLQGADTRMWQAFSFLEGQRRMPMVHTSLVQAAKRMAELEGLKPVDVAGHSFWRGGASYAFQAGVPDILIQRQDDWLSTC